MDERCAQLVVLLLVSPLLTLAVHVACARLLAQKHGQAVAALAIAIAGALVVGASMLISDFDVWSTLYGVLGFGGIGYSYFHVYNLSETARRIRILTELSEGPLTEAELLGRYRPEDALTQRIDRLVALNRLVVDGDVYRLRGRVLVWIARAVLGWRSVLGLRD